MYDRVQPGSDSPADPSEDSKLICMHVNVPIGTLLLLALQEAQSAFGAIETALRHHQPSRTSISKIAQLSKQPVPEDDGSVLQSLLDGLSTEQQARFT